LWVTWSQLESPLQPPQSDTRPVRQSNPKTHTLFTEWASVSTRKEDRFIEERRERLARRDSQTRREPERERKRERPTGKRSQSFFSLLRLSRFLGFSRLFGFFGFSKLFGFLTVFGLSGFSRFSGFCRFSGFLSRKCLESATFRRTALSAFGGSAVGSVFLKMYQKFSEKVSFTSLYFQTHGLIRLRRIGRWLSLSLLWGILRLRGENSGTDWVKLQV